MTQAQEALKQNPAYEWAGLTTALSRASLGQETEARAAYGSLKGMSPLGASLASMGEADWNSDYGRVAHARTVLADGIAQDEKTGDWTKS